MKRASYRAAISWISTEDESAETDLGAIRDSVTVALVADLFGVDPDKVAAAVLRHRRKWMREELP